MTKDDIIRMAQEAQMQNWTNDGNWSAVDDDLLRFAALVAAAEREACAKLCDEMARLYDLSIDPVEELIACETSAAIRARGNT